MRTYVMSVSLLALGLASAVQAQSGKIGVISVQSALVSTKEGQKAAAALEAKAAPKRKEMEAKQDEINRLKDQLQKGQNALSETAKQELIRTIDQKTKNFNRDLEDIRAETDADQQKTVQDLGARMMVVIDKFAKDNGYSLIVDVSSPQTPVLFASNTIDVTKAVIELYDKNSGAPSAPAQPAPASPVTAGPKPAKAPVH